MQKKNYEKLTEYLINSNKDVVTLSFSEIENILGFTLPEAAHKHRALWANTAYFAHAWTDASYKTFDVDMEKGIVNFGKNVNGRYNITTSIYSSKTKNLLDLHIEEEELRQAIDAFYIKYDQDKFSRYKSYDHCRECFLKYKDDPNKYELIALNLYAYLASWGMLRNSFLMQKDYLFNVPIVEILCDKKYSALLDNNTDVNLIMELADSIKKYYQCQTYWKEKGDSFEIVKSVTDTLVTKILLGTYGCIVAYDQNVTTALRSAGICSKFNKTSVIQLQEFIKVNKVVIDTYAEKLGVLYTPMKIIDMYFFEKGLQMSPSKKEIL